MKAIYDPKKEMFKKQINSITHLKKQTYKIARKFLKNDEEDLALPNFKTYCKTTVNETIWCVYLQQYTSEYSPK